MYKMNYYHERKMNGNFEKYRIYNLKGDKDCY